MAIFSVSQLQVYVSASAVQALTPLESALIYTLYILASAAVILIIFRFYKGKIAFVLLEAFVVFISTTFLIWIVFSTALPAAGFYHTAVAAAVITIILIIAKNKKPWLRNLLAVTSSMGVGILIGFNGFALAYALMLFIAIYDYIAVFVTKHMITLAKEISSRNLAFLIGSNDVEAIPQKYLSSKDIRQFRKETKVQNVKDPVIKRLIREGIIPTVSQVQLGSGDLAIPLMVAVSAFVSFLSYSAAVSVVIGSAFGMVFTMYLLKRYRVALPAIPPLFAFISLALGIFFVITDFFDFTLWIGFLAIALITILILMRKLKMQ
ncbi:presenilin family intramembrane aspartyl protease [Candidatus Marsarchaeota archaeon]|nr:presenilin family intramembrane aspartyl protease [Candidatus Marsarchaeota archaeon]